MKSVLIKIPAMVAMLISLISLWLYVSSIIHPDSEYWEASVFITLFSLPFFLLDALLSFIKALKKIDAGFHYILAIISMATVPMLLLFGQVNRVSFQILWNVYYLALFVLEIISIKRCIKS